MKKTLAMVSALVLLISILLPSAVTLAAQEGVSWELSDGATLNEGTGTLLVPGNQHAIYTEKIDFTAENLDFTVKFAPGFEKLNTQFLCLFLSKDLPDGRPANGENVFQVQFYRGENNGEKFCLNATWLGNDTALMAYGGPYADWTDGAAHTVRFKRVDGVVYMYINDNLVYGNAGNMAQQVSDFLTGLGTAYLTLATTSFDGSFATEVLAVNGEAPFAGNDQNDPEDSTDKNEPTGSEWIFSNEVTVDKETGMFSVSGGYATRTEAVDFTDEDLDFSVEFIANLSMKNVQFVNVYFSKELPQGGVPLLEENVFLVQFYRGESGGEKFTLNATWLGSGDALMAYGGPYADWVDGAVHSVRFKRVNGRINMFVNDTMVYGSAADMDQRVHTLFSGMGSGYLTISTTAHDGSCSVEVVKVNGASPLQPTVVSGLEWNVQPVRTQYTVGEELSVDGASVKLVYEDGSEEVVALTQDMVSGYDKNAVGEQTLTVTYQGHTTTFTVTVNPQSTAAVSSIEVKASTIREQRQYDKLNVTNTWLTVALSDGVNKEVPLTVDMVSGYDKNTTGEQTLTVTYEGKTATFTVTVLPPDLSKYTLNTYSLPYWEGNTVYLESVYPMTNPDGTNQVLQLLYDIEEIIEVRSSDLQTVYEAGKDYRVENGKLVIPEGSAIPVTPYGNHYFTENPPSSSFPCVDGGYTAFFEDATLHRRQIAVTYTHKGTWEGYVPTEQGEKLPLLQEAIRNQGTLDVLFYGDSLTVGGNSTKLLNTAPFAPNWAEMFTEYLESLGVSVNYTNTAVGGRDSSWGVSELQERVVAHAPDLLVLAFGMNEMGNFGHNNPETYKSNLLTIIRKLREVNPDAEVILVGSIQGNTEYKGIGGDRMKMTEKLYEIDEELDGVAVADVTQVHNYLLTRKNYRDMTGNNLNHVNDFLARVYLQTVIDTIAMESDEDEPGTDEPGTDDPGEDKPGTDEPGTDDPGEDKPGTDEPGTDAPGEDKPEEDKSPITGEAVTTISLIGLLFSCAIVSCYVLQQWRKSTV